MAKLTDDGFKALSMYKVKIRLTKLSDGPTLHRTTRENRIAEIVKWIEENCTGEYYKNHGLTWDDGICVIYYFELIEDATAVKLYWE